MNAFIRSAGRALYGAGVVLALSFGAVYAFAGAQDPCEPDGTVLGSCAVINCEHECLVVNGGVDWMCDSSDNCCLCAQR